ncbi:universal stress protein [Tropicimonas sp. S265A]|uniref:universal stress protein n=1 Tax=Tropicimonas sp. S265A TaxID=3415134 RepID=UPI003C7E3CBF
MYKNIIVAIALDHSPDTGKALNVAKLLAADGASITALNVIEDIPTYAANHIPQTHLASRLPEAKAELKAELGGVKGVTPVVVSGHAGRAIIEYATQQGADCIVIASHRPGLQDFFIGSTASRVVRYAKCAVHVLR